MNDALLFLDAFTPPVCSYIEEPGSAPCRKHYVAYRLLVNDGLLELADEFLEDLHSGNSYGFRLEIYEDEMLLFFRVGLNVDDENIIVIEDADYDAIWRRIEFPVKVCV